MADNTRKRQRAEDSDDDITTTDDNTQQSKKIKYSIGNTIYNTASTIVNTAAEAVILVTILGMAAYKIWNGNDKEDQQGQEKTSNKQDTLQDHTHAPHTARRPELPPPYEAVYYQSPYKLNEGMSPRRSPNNPKRTHVAARSARRRVSHPSKRQSIIENSSDSASLYSSTRPTPNQEGNSQEDDDIFNSMSIRLQSLIQQGTEALASPSSSHLDYTASSLRSDSSSERSLPQQLDPVKDRRKSLLATLIPSPSPSRHCPRLSKS